MRNRALLIASVALMAYAGLAPGASATTIKTTAGVTVSSGAAISGSLKVGTSFVISGGSAGSITCTSSNYKGSINTNPSTLSVTGSSGPWPVGGCSETIPFVTLSTMTANATAKTLTATYLGAASTLAISGFGWTVTFTDGKTCVYAPTTDPATAQHNSLTSPWNAEYAFAAIPLTKTGGTSFACPSANVTWSATYFATSGGVGITIQP